MAQTAQTAQVTYLRTAEVPLNDLTPYPGNAKKGDVEAILASLRRNSQYRSLVVREVKKGRLVVLAGNHTMQALKAHGPGDCGQTVKVGDAEQPCGICGNKAWTPTARCEVIRCDDDAARRINVADNRTSDLGEYDDKALLELLGELGGDYTGTGYTPEDYDDLLKVTGALAEETTEFLSAFTAPKDDPAQPSAPPSGPAAGPDGAVGAASLPPGGAPSPGPAAAAPGQPTPAPAAGPAAAAAAAPVVGGVSPMPPPQTTVPIQWVVTLPQRDTIRAALKHAQAAGGFETAAEALTDICQQYLSTVSEENQ
ncbi:ParB/Srx family N-terminal domain-containing protein [Thermomonospora cellulosilytica]|uniref:ParB/Sulfiredoxin domain-containing protein n=1 Tax=Thermomonospora cellulosilytica TaxID=1411118 RepID=A0A7W3N1X5_9ACTN|nr:ParB/Srx family N-terminal domain-containing protein [Thermomonospora cellulosilytica]MBA9005974.1 hypothetical protein [Thermomonospora cellulosilytica]